MQNRKSPGIDGFTVEFYKAFWDIFATDILDVFNACLEAGSLPLSCRRAVIALLPKNGDLRDIKNWRPVSLLCTDYKLLSKVLANRLRTAMEEIIHRDQTYCVPGRSLGDNVHLVRDVLHISRTLDINTGLIALDQQKAFDRVEHNYLWQVMGAFGFSTGLIAKIKVLYSDIESVLKFNGVLCSPFKVQRGVRQGCPLSGMLYTISLEPLLNLIRSSVRGLAIPGTAHSVTLSAYADDVVVMVRDQQDVRLLCSAVHKFSSVSAARVNWEKSEALAVGGWRTGLPVLPQGLVWKTDGIKYLGVYLGNDAFEKKNWENAAEKVECRLAKWRWLHGQLSFRGRVLVVNNLVASMLWHRLMVMEPPPGLLSQIQVKIVNFFWDRLHWVPQAVLFLSRGEGGQGLIHLPSRTAAFRFHFVQRYLSGSRDLVWTETANWILGRVNDLGLNTTLFLTDVSRLSLAGLPPFYRGLLKSWALLTCTRTEDNVSLHWLLKEPLVCGARLDICCDATPGLMGSLSRSRITSLGQLVHVAGPRLTDGRSLCSALGTHSVRLAQKSLNHWKRKLTTGEKLLLSHHRSGESMLNPSDPFPRLYLGLASAAQPSSPLLQDGTVLCLQDAGKKAVYTCYVKAIHQRHLRDRPESVWTNKLGGRRPQWSTVYKPPLRKRLGDLQWRVLHGAIASNAFLSVISPSVVNQCPFCRLPETVFHIFSECGRLISLFSVLTQVFLLFGASFTIPIFISGFASKTAGRTKSLLLNFLLSEARMSIYLTRRESLQGGPVLDAVVLWRQSVKARLRLEHFFHRLANTNDVFVQLWAHDDILCHVSGGELRFAQFLI